MGRSIRFIFIITIVLSLVLLSACNSTSSNGKEILKEPSKLAKDDIYLSIEDVDLKITKGLNVSSEMEFHILSGFELEDGEIYIDIDTPYIATISEVEIEKGVEIVEEEVEGIVEEMEMINVPYYIYLLYQDTDWRKMHDLDTKRPKSDKLLASDFEAIEAFSDYYSRYDKEWKEFARRDPYKDGYYYSVYINFNILESEVEKEEVFHNILLKTKEKEYDFNIGRVELDYDSDIQLDAEFIDMLSLGQFGRLVHTNKEGILTVDGLEFVSKKDMVIKDIKVLNPDLELANVNFGIEEGSIVLNKEFNKGDNLKIKEGSNVRASINVKDENLIGNPFYYNLINLLIEYEMEGESYNMFYETSLSTKASIYEIIAIKVDNLDILPYYHDFYSLTE